MPRVAAAAAITTMLAAAALVGCSTGYEGPGTDHAFVGRSVDEIQPCETPGCDVGGINDGTIDGTVVRIVEDVSSDEPEFSDLACHPDRLDLVVDGDAIVAATESC